MHIWTSYNQECVGAYPSLSSRILSFLILENRDAATVASFGEEWEKFHDFSDTEITQIAAEYFDILPKSLLDKNSAILDVGCGSGRWAKHLANLVGTVDAIDPSSAVEIAAKNLSSHKNVRVTHAGVDNIPFADETFDLVMSIGVLHHVPDTEKAIRNCISKVKKGGYFYVYLYYKLDNRGLLFRGAFLLSHGLRLVISRLPSAIKKLVCDVIALTIYLPLAKVSSWLQAFASTRALGRILPLSFYSDKSLYIMRNDALDRFGTQLEQRFSKAEIQDLLSRNGLSNIVFSPQAPYWHAVGQRL